MPRIAVVQLCGAPLERWRKTQELVTDLVCRAAAERAEIVVLPECVWPAYNIGSKQAFFRARAEGLPGAQVFLDGLRRLAKRERIAICAGYIAEREERLFNAACLISTAGELLGSYHKCFLWDFDRDWFEPGRRIEPLDTEFGKIGVMICADARLPEIPATLAARGARLILQPTAWVHVGDDARLYNPQPDYLIPARAREFGVPIASASKCGKEADTQFTGSSLICDATGRIAAQCDATSNEVIIADVELGEPRRAVMTDAERARLLSEAPPEPADASVPLVCVRLDYPSGAKSVGGTPGGCATVVFHRLEPDLPVDETVNILSLEHARLSSETVSISGPSDGIIDFGGVRVAGVGSEALKSFAVTRALALRGVHVVVAVGDEIHESLLKTRASENRIFVIASTPKWVEIFDPTGSVSALTKWPPAEQPVAGSGGRALTLLNVAAAAKKQVAPNTDVILGRNPVQYEF